MRPRLFAFVALLPLAACGGGHDPDPSQAVGPHPVLPAPQEGILPEISVPRVVGWKAGEAPTVPAGFRIQALATGLANPRTVYTLPNGDILVVETQITRTEPIDRPKVPVRGFVMRLSHGGGLIAKSGPPPPQRITLLRDSDGDGRPELRTILVDHLNSPFGVAYLNGYLYVANTDSLVRYPFTPGQTQINAPAEKVLGLPGGLIDHHWTKSLTVSPDGSKLYVGVGSNSNVQERGPEAETDRAAIWEVDVASGAHRLIATGTRNPTALSFYPGSNSLWAAVQERDELGPNLVPDYITAIRPGGFYGWPYSYFGQHVDPRVRPQRPDLVARAIVPDYALGAHVAVLGLAFYTGASFPAAYRGGAFIGEHGSWNRAELNGYRVVYIPFAGGRPAGMPVTFVGDFLNSKGEARGRPVGVALDRTGALLVADDAGKTVWRVSYAGR
ncbi:MAG TPA: sorbosone dehydrogenase family protein [Sphingomicrobium sp.]|nr:sorbosone dehydrogenase family protein [Sphingomicrobium sp.]